MAGRGLVFPILIFSEVIERRESAFRVLRWTSMRVNRPSAIYSDEGSGSLDMVESGMIGCRCCLGWYEVCRDLYVVYLVSLRHFK